MKTSAAARAAANDVNERRCAFVRGAIKIKKRGPTDGFPVLYISTRGSSTGSTLSIILRPWPSASRRLMNDNIKDASRPDGFASFF